MPLAINVKAIQQQQSTIKIGRLTELKSERYLKYTWVRTRKE